MNPAPGRPKTAGLARNQVLPASYNVAMLPFGARLLVAFDASSISAGLVSWGLRGLRVRRLVQASLSPGALVPSPFETNVARPEEVRAALRSAREGLQSNGRRAFLILPDGLARIVLLDVPAGASALEYARFRLSQLTPFAPGEAIVSALSVGQRRILAASVRRKVVEGYESVAAAAGFSQGRLSLAPLAAVVGFMRCALGSSRTLGLFLGSTALSLAVFDGGELGVFRCRRRDPGPGEAARLASELARTVSLAGDAPAPSIRVVGPGAVALARDLATNGWPAEAGWRLAGGAQPVETVGQPWLGAAAG